MQRERERVGELPWGFIQLLLSVKGSGKIGMRREENFSREFLLMFWDVSWLTDQPQVWQSKLGKILGTRLSD